MGQRSERAPSLELEGAVRFFVVDHAAVRHAAAMAPPWSSAVNAAAAGLSPYVPADPPGVRYRLDANEAPATLLEALRPTLATALASVSSARYPDACGTALRASLARWLGSSPDRFVLGSGSDEIIAMLTTAFNRPRDGRARPVLAIPSPTFVMYRATALLHGFDVVEVPLDDAFALDEAAMRAAIAEHAPNLVFLASPNNPTAAAVDPEAVVRLAAFAPGTIVVLDEAYGPFSSRQPKRSAAEPENLVRMGTLSKIGLAALRVGWLEAAPSLARVVDVVRLPFNTSATSQALAAAVLDAHAPLLGQVACKLVAERERLAAALRAHGGVTVYPSDANFLWIEVPGRAADVWAALVGEGVLVRSFAGKGGRLDRCLRVTVGDPEANDAFLAAWAKVASR
jgi:histidinol-phosphate aminotransferase